MTHPYEPYPEPEYVAGMTRARLAAAWLRLPPPENAAQEQVLKLIIERLTNETRD